MILRPATLDDADQLASLSGQLGYASVETEVADRLAAILKHDDQVVFVAHTDNVIIGWIHAFRADRVESEPFVEIGGLVVDEAWRGRGAGRALLEFIGTWAREQGLRSLRVRTNVVREDARAFYERLGFRESKQQRVYSRAVRER